MRGEKPMAQQAAAAAIISACSSKPTVPRVIAEGDRLCHSKFVALRDGMFKGARQEMCEAAETGRR